MDNPLNFETIIDMTIAEVLKLPPSELNNELSVDEIEGWDSLTHMNLIVTLEEKLQIMFSIDQIASMRTIGEIRLAAESHIQK